MIEYLGEVQEEAGDRGCGMSALPRRMTPARSRPDPFQVESALMDAKGDMLLLGLAVEGVEERWIEAIRLGRIGNGGRMES